MNEIDINAPRQALMSHRSRTFYQTLGNLRAAKERKRQHDWEDVSRKHQGLVWSEQKKQWVRNDKLFNEQMKTQEGRQKRDKQLLEHAGARETREQARHEFQMETLYPAQAKAAKVTTARALLGTGYEEGKPVQTRLNLETGLPERVETDISPVAPEKPRPLLYLDDQGKLRWGQQDPITGDISKAKAEEGMYAYDPRLFSTSSGRVTERDRLRMMEKARDQWLDERDSGLTEKEFDTWFREDYAPSINISAQGIRLGTSVKRRDWTKFDVKDKKDLADLYKNFMEAPSLEKRQEVLAGAPGEVTDALMQYGREEEARKGRAEKAKAKAKSGIAKMSLFPPSFFYGESTPEEQRNMRKLFEEEEKKRRPKPHSLYEPYTIRFPQ